MLGIDMKQNDEVNEQETDYSIQLSAENAMKETDDADLHEQECEDLQSAWES